MLMQLREMRTALIMWLMPASLKGALVDAEVDKQLLDYLQSTGCYLMLQVAMSAEICIAVPGLPIRPQLARARDMGIGKWIGDVLPDLERTKAEGRLQ